MQIAKQKGVVVRPNGEKQVSRSDFLQRDEESRVMGLPAPSPDSIVDKLLDQVAELVTDPAGTVGRMTAATPESPEKSILQNISEFAASGFGRDESPSVMDDLVVDGGTAGVTHVTPKEELMAVQETAPSLDNHWLTAIKRDIESTVTDIMTNRRAVEHNDTQDSNDGQSPPSFGTQVSTLVTVSAKESVKEILSAIDSMETAIRNFNVFVGGEERPDSARRETEDLAATVAEKLLHKLDIVRPVWRAAAPMSPPKREPNSNAIKCDELTRRIEQKMKNARTATPAKKNVISHVVTFADTLESARTAESLESHRSLPEEVSTHIEQDAPLPSTSSSNEIDIATNKTSVLSTPPSSSRYKRPHVKKNFRDSPEVIELVSQRSSPSGDLPQKLENSLAASESPRRTVNKASPNVQEILSLPSSPMKPSLVTGSPEDMRPARTARRSFVISADSDKIALSPPPFVAKEPTSPKQQAAAGSSNPEPTNAAVTPKADGAPSLMQRTRDLYESVVRRNSAVRTNSPTVTNSSDGTASVPSGHASSVASSVFMNAKLPRKYCKQCTRVVSHRGLVDLYAEQESAKWQQCGKCIDAGFASFVNNQLMEGTGGVANTTIGLVPGEFLYELSGVNRLPILWEVSSNPTAEDGPTSKVEFNSVAQLLFHEVAASYSAKAQIIGLNSPEAVVRLYDSHTIELVQISPQQKLSVLRTICQLQSDQHPMLQKLLLAIRDRGNLPKLIYPQSKSSDSLIPPEIANIWMEIAGQIDKANLS